MLFQLVNIYSVKEFVNLAGSYFGMKIIWKGKGL